MKYFNREKENAIEKKADGSPATMADTAAETIILAGLQSLTPSIPIVSEEAFERGEIPDISGGEFWLVDPLDGTREFLRGGIEFTVNIGLIQANEPVLGVLYSPATGEMYSGYGNVAKFSDIQGNERKIQVRKSPNDGLTIISSRNFGSEIHLARFLAGRTISEHLYRSSALKFGDIADGKADLYPRFGPSCEWDTAAGHAIVNAAGGSVKTADNTPLLYGKPNFINADFVARGAR
jgi:3'(2'), 5'-bisphosphate nucleotidase